jgi:hypothetical protein
MAKLTKDETKRLEALNLTAKNPEDAKKAVLQMLKKHEITDVEEEEIGSLLDMAEAFAEEEVAEEETEDEEEGEEDEESDEEEAPAPAPKGKKAAPAPAPAAKGKKLPAPDDEEDLDEAADEAAAKPKKGAAVPAPKAATKAAPAPKADKKATPAKKAAAAETPSRVRGERFDPENEDHLKLLKPLNKRFPKDKYEHKLGKDGVSVRLKDTESTNRTVFVYNGLRVVDGELKGMMNFNALRLGNRDAEGTHPGEKLIRKAFVDNDDLLDRLTMEDTLPKIKSATVAEVIEMCDALLGDMEGKLTKLDTHLNKNKAALEKNMGTTSKKDGKGKAAAPVVDEDEQDEEEEAPAPAPKGKKAKPAPAPEVEEEDEEEEEEEEAPAPKAKKGGDKKSTPAPAAKTTKKK